MTSNKRTFQTNEEDEPSHKIQKTGHNDTIAESYNINILGSGPDNLINDSKNILEACKTANLDLLKVLVARGISVHEKTEDNETCLLIASANGNLDIVKYLLEKGTDINEKAFNGDTSLLLATFDGHFDIVKYLLENGSDINAKSNNGSSCILLASYNGHLDIIKWFVLEKGCSLQDMNIIGTCIMNAARKNHFKCVLWMLSNGASLNENTKLDDNGNIIECESCEDILKRKGKFDELKRIFETKSSKQ